VGIIHLVQKIEVNKQEPLKIMCREMDKISMPCSFKIMAVEHKVKPVKSFRVPV
jgi:hypothetical protein